MQFLKDGVQTVEKITLRRDIPKRENIQLRTVLPVTAEDTRCSTTKPPCSLVTVSESSS